jgi:hypothetical protein
MRVVFLVVVFVAFFYIPILSFFESWYSESKKAVELIAAEQWAGDIGENFSRGLFRPFNDPWFEKQIKAKYHDLLKGQLGSYNYDRMEKSFQFFKSKYAEDRVGLFEAGKDNFRPLFAGNTGLKKKLLIVDRYLAFIAENEFLTGELRSIQDTDRQCLEKHQKAREAKQKFVQSFDEDWKRWSQGGSDSAGILEKLQLAEEIRKLDRGIAEAETFCADAKTQTMHAWRSFFWDVVNQESIDLHTLADANNSEFFRMLENFQFSGRLEDELIEFVWTVERMRRNGQIADARKLVHGMIELTEEPAGKK